MAFSRRWAHQVNREIDKASTERRHDSMLSDKEQDLNSYRIKVEMAALVLWECLSEMGVTREELELKMKEIRDRGWTITPPSFYQLCPKCGRKVFDYSEKRFEAACVYCGQTINIYPAPYPDETSG